MGACKFEQSSDYDPVVLPVEVPIVCEVEVVDKEQTPDPPVEGDDLHRLYCIFLLGNRIQKVSVICLEYGVQFRQPI